MNALPYTASVDMYTGGGYVYRINKPDKQVKRDLLELQQQHWINNHTRAVFLEFSTYNSNVSHTSKIVRWEYFALDLFHNYFLQLNLFVIATIVAEFIPGGGILPYSRFEVVRLLHHHEELGTYLMIAETVFVFYILYFIVVNLNAMKKMKHNYWKTYWSMAEWVLIGLASLAGLLYAYRLGKYYKSVNILYLCLL